MRVIMKVLDVDIKSIKNGTSQLANVTMKSDGDTAITVTMFDKDIEAGKANHLKQLEGQYVVTDINSEIRDGDINFRFAYQAQVMPYKAFVQNEASKIKPAPSAAPSSSSPAASQQQKAS